MNTEVMQTPQFTKGRLLLLGVASVVLCLSFIMSVFAPFPLALANILYGRGKGFLTGVCGLVVSFLFANFIYQDLTLFGFYAGAFIFGTGIAEIVRRGISPVKGLVTFGLAFILLVAAAISSIVISRNVSLEQMVLTEIQKSSDKIAEQKKIIEQSADKDAIQVLQLLDRPDLIAKEVIRSFPSYFFIGVFIMLWFNMFLVLKSRRLLLSGHDYQYSERNLLNFKVPFGYVSVLVVGLVMAVWGGDLGYPAAENWGITIIKCLGIFYFFQGFGVFSDLLSFLGILGFFRTLLVIFVVFSASYLIAVAGLFDNWFEFRKYFVKRNKEE